MSNKINPNKLLRSKWTAVTPENKELHFIVTKLMRDDEDIVVACELEAVINENSYQIDWQLLKDTDTWVMGWK